MLQQYFRAQIKLQREASPRRGFGFYKGNLFEFEAKEI